MRARLASIAILLAGCAASSAVVAPSPPPRARIDAPSGATLMLGVVTAEDGRQGFANVFFLNVEPRTSRCAVVDEIIDGGAVCTIRDCRGDSGTLPERLIDLGELSILSPSRPTVVSRPDAAGSYVFDGTTGLRWLPGDEVRVAIAGGADGAGAAVDFTLPPTPRMITPRTPPAGLPMLLTRSAPLRVTWEPFDALAIVYVGQSPPESDFWLRELTLECAIDGAAGELTLPTSILGRLATSGYSTYFGLGARSYLDQPVGARTVRFMAESARSFWADLH